MNAMSTPDDKFKLAWVNYLDYDDESILIYFDKYETDEDDINVIRIEVDAYNLRHILWLESHIFCRTKPSVIYFLKTLLLNRDENCYRNCGEYNIKIELNNNRYKHGKYQASLNIGTNRSEYLSYSTFETLFQNEYFSKNSKFTPTCISSGKHLKTEDLRWFSKTIKFRPHQVSLLSKGLDTKLDISFKYGWTHDDINLNSYGFELFSTLDDLDCCYNQVLVQCGHIDCFGELSKVAWNKIMKYRNNTLVVWLNQIPDTIFSPIRKIFAAYFPWCNPWISLSNFIILYKIRVLPKDILYKSYSNLGDDTEINLRQIADLHRYFSSKTEEAYFTQQMQEDTQLISPKNIKWLYNNFVYFLRNDCFMSYRDLDLIVKFDNLETDFSQAINSSSSSSSLAHNNIFDDTNSFLDSHQFDSTTSTTTTHKYSSTMTNNNSNSTEQNNAFNFICIYTNLINSIRI